MMKQKGRNILPIVSEINSKQLLSPKKMGAEGLHGRFAVRFV